MLDWIGSNGLLFLTIVFFVGITVFHLLEPLAPVHAHYKAGVTRRGYVADIVSLIVNGPGLSALEKIAFTWLVTLVPVSLGFMQGWSWWAQFAVFFLVNDFLRYWFHRWYHESNLLWRVHRVHHTIVEMDAMSVFRHHVLEAIIKNCLIFLPLRLMGVSASVIIIYSTIDILKGLWHHANFRTRIGWLNYIVNSPELHWWHHETDPRGQMSNYGSTLSIWDVLFGTFYYRPGEWPEQIGVEGMAKFPDGYAGQLSSIRYDDAGMIEACHRVGEGEAPAEPVRAADPGEPRLSGSFALPRGTRAP